jgi:hypothetical protein
MGFRFQCAIPTFFGFSWTDARTLVASGADPPPVPTHGYIISNRYIVDILKLLLKQILCYVKNNSRKVSFSSKPAAIDLKYLY